ncbi:MAG: DUF3846 domain-containing protein [Anaerobutyricum sp.]|jgi:hypothetical protein
MKILAVRTGEPPEIIDIEHSLDAESEFVGGYIQTIFLSHTAILVCNDDGKIIGLKPNRVIPGDFIAGDFFVVGFDGRDDFCDISDSDAAFYMDFFSSPNSYC